MRDHLLFDIESDGLLDAVTKIHVIVTKDIVTGQIRRYSSKKNNIVEGIKALEEAATLVGHNIMDYDLRAIKKLYPWFKPKGLIRDTLVISRLIWTDLRDRDFNRVKKQEAQKHYREDQLPYPKNLIGSHSLKAWGLRLSNLKDDYDGGWVEWNQPMEDYCVQDVEVTHTLWKLIVSKEYSEEAVQLEHDVQAIILRQTVHGFAFNTKAANALYVKLQIRAAEIEEELQAIFKPWWVSAGVFVPKGHNQKLGYTGGAALTKVKMVVFNPGSRDHIANRLVKLYKWKPKAFGADGKPTVDEEILKALRYPVAPLLTEYLTIVKRMGQIADGKQGWLRAEKLGRIHGKVNTNGAVTGRMTHSTPNMAQVPSVKKGKKDGVEVVLMDYEGGWGYECRSLFTASAGNLLTGADASGLELRCLAHYMARWDKGDYAEIVLHGDIHTVNQHAAGLPTRNEAKTFIYAFLYGAGDEKIGSIIGQGRKAGGLIKKQFLAGLPALDNLIKAVQQAARTNGFLRGLDGRLLHIRSPHAALNTLLQSAGAVVMKKALVILDNDLQSLGLIPGVDYEFSANIHDEWQIDHKPELKDVIQQTATRAITKSGEHFSFRCRLDGEAKTGVTWADTH